MTEATYDNAKTAFEAGQKDDAYAMVQQVLAAQPDHAKANALMANILADRDGYDLAAVKQYVDRAHGLDRDDIYVKMTRETLGSRVLAVAVQKAKLAQEKLNKGDVASAHELTDYALHLIPNYMLARVVKARAYLAGDDGDRLEKAEKLCDEALAVDPNFNVAKQVKAKIAFQRRDYVTAEVILKEAVLLKPDDREGRIMLAVLALKTHKPEEALHYADTVLELSPQHRHATILKTEAYLMQDKLPEAEDTIRNMVLRAPTHGPIQRMLAKVQRIRGDYAGALDTLARYSLAVHQNADDPIECEEARLLLLAGNICAAEKRIDRYLDHHPKDPEALWVKAQALFAKGDKAAAMSQVAGVLKLVPDNTEALAMQRTLLEEAGQPDSPLANLLGPQILRYKEAKRTGNKKLAHEVLDQLIRIKPDDPSGYCNKAHLYFLSNDTDKAVHYVECALKVAPTNQMALLLKARYALYTNNTATAADAVSALQKHYPDSSGAAHFTARLHLKRGEFPQAWEVLVHYSNRNFDLSAVKLMHEMVQYGLADKFTDVKGTTIDRPAQYTARLDMAREMELITPEQYAAFRVVPARIHFNPGHFTNPKALDDELDEMIGRVDRSASAFRSDLFITPVNKLAFDVGNFIDYFREGPRRIESQGAARAV